MSSTTTHSTAPAALAPKAQRPIPDELIARRAYELWLRRGCRRDTELADWYHAEAELKAARAHRMP